jgi:hypothetical protein
VHNQRATGGAERATPTRMGCEVHWSLGSRLQSRRWVAMVSLQVGYVGYIGNTTVQRGSVSVTRPETLVTPMGLEQVGVAPNLFQRPGM